MKVGFHIATASNLKKMADLVQKTRGNSFQFFSRNMRGGAVPKYKDKQLYDYYNFLFEKRVSTAIMHLPLFYKISGNKQISGNLAVENPELINEILIDLENAKKLHVKYFVVHTGYYKDSSEEEGIKMIKKNLEEILEKTDWSGTILVRNPAGEGTQVGSNLFNFSKIFSKENPRIKVALDFGRLYAAGYNILNELELNILMKLLEKEIGFENIPVIYINDSIRFCGAKKEKSSVAVGEGTIGFSGYARILAKKEFSKTVRIIEYHNDDQKYYDKILNFLLEMDKE